jgi:hypothetical protein
LLHQRFMMVRAGVGAPTTRRGGAASGSSWGELDEHDLQANEVALAQGLRLFAAYTDRAHVRFWIITEHDRSVTTILLPDDRLARHVSNLAAHINLLSDNRLPLPKRHAKQFA